MTQEINDYIQFIDNVFFLFENELENNTLNAHFRNDQLNRGIKVVCDLSSNKNEIPIDRFTNNYIRLAHRAFYLLQDCAKKGDRTKMDAIQKICKTELQNARVLCANMDPKSRKIFSEALNCADQMAEHAVKQASINLLPPIGIKNPMNNCWATSLLQVIFNANASFKNCKFLADLKKDYTEAQLNTHRIARGLSERLRAQLASEIQGFSPNSGHQEDAHEALINLIEKIQPNFLIEEVKTSSINDTSIKTNEESMIQFPIHENTEFVDLIMDASFDYRSELGDSHKCQLKSLPNHLFVQAKRFTDELTKNSTPLNKVPEVLILPESIISETISNHAYELRGCIIHKGKNLNGGHYVALIKKPSGKWFLANDATVTPISNKKIPELLSQGYIFHYEKIDESL